MDSTFKVNNNCAVIYARYSSDSQSEQSIEGQVRVISDYAKKNNIPIINSYIDRAISGRREDRPEFQRMIADAKKKGFGYVLVYKYDRFSRDRLNSLVYKRELKKCGVKVISVTEYISDDPQGILFESIIDGYSEYYSAELAQKVKRGNRESRMKGMYTGGKVIYGYKIVDKRYEIIPEEANIIKMIFDKAGHGETYASIAKELNEKGMRHNDREFTERYIHKMTHNKKYIGVVETNGEVFTNIVPPIVDEETFYKTWKASSTKKKRGSHYRRKDEYLLTGKLYCGYCGELLTSDSGTGRNGVVRHYYKCSTRKIKRQQCECKVFKKEYLEDLVVSKIVTAILQSKKMEQITNYLCIAYNQGLVESNLLSANEKELAKKQREIDNALNAILCGIVNDSLKQKLNQLEEEKKILEEENIKLKIRINSRMTPEQAMNFLNKLIDFHDTSLEYKRKLINRLVKKVIVYNDRITVVLNDNDLNLSTNNNGNDGGDGSMTSPSCPPLNNNRQKWLILRKKWEKPPFFIFYRKNLLNFTNMC